MAPRIQFAEVLSFRLHVPIQALERLTHDLRNELPLTVVEDTNGIKLSHEDAESFLRFRPRAEDAVLVEVVLSNDEQGLFFQRVVQTLLAQYQGDLQAKLVWDTKEKNTQGTHALVNVRRGVMQSSGSARATTALRNTLVAAGDGGEGEGDPFDNRAGQESLPSADEDLLSEVEKLLARGKAHWDEYQKLKGGK